MTNINLLLVEDDEDDYLLTADLLERITPSLYTLDWAPSADVGREQLAKNKHDLCLMDYRLGAEDGLELLRAAPALGFEGPIIMLTGQNDSVLDAEALEAGAVDYLVKESLDEERLARAIRYALARKEMERERVDRLRAEADSRSKSAFLAHLSHELRTPLTAILGYAELLSVNSHGDEKSQLQIIERNGRHLLSLLNDTLDLSKIEAGKLEIEQKDIELNGFLTDIYCLMDVAARDKNLELKINLGTELPRTIQSDPTRLRQILINLLSNAIKFTEYGEVELQIRVIRRSEQELLEFVVRDTGIGIDESDLEKIFQPFSQSASPKARLHGGSGLGLAISRELAVRLGGSISVKSNVGRGSEFRLVINPGDISGARRYELPLHSKSGSTSRVPTEKLSGRVLVVDDLMDIRRLIGHLVSQTGVEVSYASNGREAVNLICARESQPDAFDLVMMDINMPEMNGLEAVQVLRQWGYPKPVIALTAASMMGEKEKCLSAGFTEYLSKPIGAPELVKCLKKHLAPPEVECAQKPIHVLLIEDNIDASNATSALLQHLGCTVHTVHSGDEALVAFSSHSPDLTLLDLNLPDIDGYTLAKRLKQIHPQARIISLSGSTPTEALAENSGIERHLMKPIDITQLTTVLGK